MYQKTSYKTFIPDVRWYFTDIQVARENTGDCLWTFLAKGENRNSILQRFLKESISHDHLCSTRMRLSTGVYSLKIFCVCVKLLFRRNFKVHATGCTKRWWCTARQSFCTLYSSSFNQPCTWLYNYSRTERMTSDCSGHLLWQFTWK